MKNLIFLLTMVFALTMNANINSDDFDKLKKLEGKWMGMLERTDGTSDMLNLVLVYFEGHNSELLIICHYDY